MRRPSIGDHLIAGDAAFAVEDRAGAEAEELLGGGGVVRAMSAVAAMAASELSLDMAASPRVVWEGV